ncbi:hypothetical protein Sjap_016007 [Stephania japonica]|uniref:Trichome birefringence-like N-terminal domain-containing protein n=1 Tax=Stephania japonica TaxID=461633 RepID=A0AAP0IL15_9MAGN
MGTKFTFKDHSHHFLTKKLLPFALYALIPLLLFRLYIHPIHSFKEHVPQIKEQVPEQNKIVEIASCDYTNGNWVPDKLGPLYNGTSCNTIKEGQNCISHGRADMGFLYWRWKPKQCNLPRFQPLQFLNILSNKHLAFVGDSMARNQLESLLCLLSSVSSPVLVYRDGDDNKFRKWHFPSHNLNVSVFWSPFLVKGVEKNVNLDHNKLFLDSIDGRWGGELDDMDMVVLSLGHWYLHPAVYYEGNTILGCHYCPGLNHTEIGFYDVFRKAWRTTLDALLRRREKPLDVIVTTFSPSHFEGEWDKAGACPKRSPLKKGRGRLRGWMKR